MSSETKHTPGPWVIGAGYGRYKTEITGPGRAVGGVWTRRDAGALSDERRIEDDPEGIANARLIAAAPELLEAAKSARDALAVAIKAAWEGSTDADVAEHVVIKKLDAAIARATGQEG